MKSFNVIIEDNGKFEPYDIMPFLLNEYNDSEDKPESFEDLKKLVEASSRYRFWSRCEYEIILVDWPGQTKAEKWDIYRQIMMNLDLITEILLQNINDSK